MRVRSILGRSRGESGRRRGAGATPHRAARYARREKVMRPDDDPQFFRWNSPDGRSRESTIRLDAQGRFWHDGAPVRHRGLLVGLHTWIRRHPDNGRYILSNGYDWTYLTVDDAPFFVRLVRIEPHRIVLGLSDGTEESWRPEATRLAADGAIYATVKTDAQGGPYEAKFTRHAQVSLAPALVETDDAAAAVNLSGRVIRIGVARP